MLRLNLFLSILLCALVSKADVNAVFNWASPSSLSPAYASPSSANRYGDHISNVEFNCNGVTLSIDDDNVSDEADKARFVYNIYTDAAELRSNSPSVIKISAPDGMYISKVQFDGTKADDKYISAANAIGTFSNGSWAASSPDQVAYFNVISTINCSKITVYCTQLSGVTDIATSTEANSSSAQWFSIYGEKLTQRPSTPGVYIIQINNSFKKVLIR